VGGGGVGGVWWGGEVGGCGVFFLGGVCGGGVVWVGGGGGVGVGWGFGGGGGGGLLGFGFVFGVFILLWGVLGWGGGGVFCEAAGEKLSLAFISRRVGKATLVPLAVAWRSPSQVPWVRPKKGNAYCKNLPGGKSF